MKRFTRILSLLLVLLLLAGCDASAQPEASVEAAGNDRTEEASEPGRETVQQTTTVSDTEPVYETESVPAETTVPPEPVQVEVMVGQYSKDSIAWWQAFETQFETENPDVDLVVEVVSWMDLSASAYSLIEQDAKPDILNATTAICSYALKSGVLLPADSYLSAETRDRIYPRLLEGYGKDAATWALPLVSIPWAMIYNPEILDAAGVTVPTDWEELENACRTIRSQMPQVLPWGLDYVDEYCFVIYTLNNGGGFFDDSEEWFLNSDENLEAVQFVQRMTDSGLANKDLMASDWSALRDLYAQEEVAMMLMPMHGLDYWEYSDCTVPYEIAPIPANTGCESSSLVNMECFLCFDNGQSEQEMDAIRRFYDFFYEVQRYMDYVSTENLYPVTVDAAEQMSHSDPSLARLPEIMASCYALPMMEDAWTDIWWELKDFMYLVLEEGENPARLLDELQYIATGR